MSVQSRIDIAWAALKPKRGVHHVTLSAADWVAMRPLAERMLTGDAFVYRGRPVVRGPHYHGPGVLWSQYGNVLHPNVLT